MSNSNDKTPLISICIPTYNADKTVMDTINSILNQTYKNLEIIIVDNASNDETLTIVNKFIDPRIKIYKNCINIGAENSFSRCIELATGEYIAIFHADDIYLPDMIKKQVQAFQANSSVGAVFTMAYHINDKGELIGEHKIPVSLKGKRIYYFNEIFISIMENLNFLICPSAIVKSEIYKKLSPFRGEKFGTSADLDMWLRILEICPISILEEKLMNYRLSRTQGSHVYGHLRTEEADFFKVMNYYLSKKSGVLNIPKRALNKYELLITRDKIMRTLRFLYKGQSRDAKRLMKESFSFTMFKAAISCIGEPRFLAELILGPELVNSIPVRVENFFQSF
jgi:glycosyltransferase involved in cell wall biosynthesis